MENDNNNNTTTTTTTRELVGAQKIQTAGVVVADPQSRTIAQSPSFQAKKKRRQSLGGRRVSFAQPRELEEVREYYKVRNEEGHYPTILFFYSKRERERRGTNNKVVNSSFFSLSLSLVYSPTIVFVFAIYLTTTTQNITDTSTDQPS
jgi:hypothetical protein